MQPSTRKAELLEQVRATHQALESLLSGLDPSQMTQPGVNGEWSVKDVLAHITWWEQHTLRRLRTGHDDLYADGVDVPATTDRANAEVFAANRARPLDAVLADFAASYQEVLAALEALLDAALADPDLYDAVAWDTFRHYPEHTAMLAAWLTPGSSAAPSAP
jgi:uncharacterized protein (TIGR03083 family)